jgi:hypothetical protein
MGIDSGDDAYIYANTTDFDDDRTCRLITYSSLTGTLNIGDTITLGANTCVIVKFDADEIKVQNRSADIDAFTGSATTDQAASFTVDSIGLANLTASTDSEKIGYIWPKDHYTVQKALTWATVGGTVTTESNIGTIEAQPPKCPVWTFLWAPFDDVVSPKEHKLNFNMNWKVRLQ